MRLFCLVFLPFFTNAYEIIGKVVGVTDGDTITILDESKKQHKINLDGIDAPEIGQAFGKDAKRMLSDFIYNRTIKGDCKEADKQGNHVCTVFVESININAAMIFNGGAWVFVKYYPEGEYYQLEKTAKESKSGLWQDKYFSVPPWEWRDGNYSQAAIDAKNKPQSSDTVVKMSRSRICHDISSQYYSRTKKFTAYDTLEDCLNAGGRLPKN